MIRCTSAHVDLEATRANYRSIADYLSKEAALNRSAARGPAAPPQIIAVIKANAYGHGAVRIARALEEAGATWLAVADIEEGVELREAGSRARILVFGALSVSDLAGVFEYELTPTVASPAAGRALQRAAAAREARMRYHLKIDTGMHRLGFRHENLKWTIPELLDSANLELEAVYTHFATADEPEHALFDQQRVRVRQGAARRSARSARRPGTATPPTAPRSSATHASWYDFVRPGLLLHGVVPPPLATTISLAPVHVAHRVESWRSKGIRSGETVGYGARFTADRADDARRDSGRIRGRSGSPPREPGLRARSAATARASSARSVWTC